MFLQLFDVDNPLNKQFSKYLFTTEGHLLPIGSILRAKPWTDDEFSLKLSCGQAPRKDSFSEKLESTSASFFRKGGPLLKSNATQPSVSFTYFVSSVAVWAVLALV